MTSQRAMTYNGVMGKEGEVNGNETFLSLFWIVLNVLYVVNWYEIMMKYFTLLQYILV